MATREAIAQMRDSALGQLREATGAISATLGIDAPVMPELNRDPDYSHAAQLKALAEWAEGVAQALTPQFAGEGSTHDNAGDKKTAKSRRDG